MATLTGTLRTCGAPASANPLSQRHSVSLRPDRAHQFTTKAPAQQIRLGRRGADVQNFKFMKDLGFKKPEFLPDFGKEKRKALLDRFYNNFDVQTYNELLADNFEIVEAGETPKPYGKQDWITLLLDYTLPAIPDFSWSHATDGAKDKDGYSIVIVQATGHHTGKAFTLPGSDLPPVEPSGKRFVLEEEKVRVKVEDGKIQRMEVLPAKGAGPLALYKALGGTVPASKAVSA